MAKSLANLTFVTVCKDRLHHLQISLPRMLAQTGCKTIVVDSKCPQDSARWVREHHPEATALKLDDQGNFNLAQARNFGLQSVDSEWVCFIDADVIVKADFWSEVKIALRSDQYYTFRPSQDKFGITGTFIGPADEVRKAGGYDEVPTDYGGEDYELYDALTRRGCKNVILSSDLIEKVIQHSTADRTKYYARKNIKHSIIINGLYRILKKHVRNANPLLDKDVDQRKKIYAEAEHATNLALESEPKIVEFQIELPRDPIIYTPFAELDQKLTLKLSIK